MEDKGKKKEQLINELVELRKRIAELEASETERKQAEKPLRESEYKSILKELPDIVYKIDPDGYFTFINNSVRILGYEPEELIGKHFSKIIHPDDVKSFSRSIVLPKCKGKVTSDEKSPNLFDERRTGKRKTKDLEVRLIPKRRKRTKNYTRKIVGTVIAFSDACSTGHYGTDVKKKDKKILGSLGIIKEITERRRVEQELEQSFERLQRNMQSIIYTIAKMVEARDPFTAGHQQRVANLARVIAKEMDLPEEQISGIYMAAVIHDVGKVYVPDEILGKPSRLTKSEFGVIKAHPQVGYDILKMIEFSRPVAQIVFQHHERMNGSGYPRGLTGDNVLLEARILAVADVVEALASQRPYRSALSKERILEEILQNRGVLYDPNAVDACLKLFTEKGFRF